MALIRADQLGDDLEDKVADAGPYEIRCTSAVVKKSKKTDRDMIALGFKIEPDDGYATVWHNLNCPLDSDEPATVRRMLRDQKRMLTMLDIPLDTDIAEDNVAEVFVGRTGKCPLRKVEARDANDEKTGEWRNELSLPKV